MEKTWQGEASLDVDSGEVQTIYGGSGSRSDDVEAPLSEILNKINERFGSNISENDLLFQEQMANDIVADPQIQLEALANDELSFAVGFEDTWKHALVQRLSFNEKYALQLMDDNDLNTALLEQYRPRIYRRARVAAQRTCPIGDLINPDGETRFLEYKSTMRWDVRDAKKNKAMEDAIVKTIAGFANSEYGGTLLVGVADDGTVHGLEDDYATFSKRGERGDRDLWGQHLKNLCDRLGAAAATLVDWEFFTIDGNDLCRIDIDPSGTPVYDAKGDQSTFWWRTPVSTDRVPPGDQLDQLIARRWPS